MKITRISSSVAAFLLAICICSIKGDACGGLFESDAGEFELPLSNNYGGDLECVWVIQLLSRRTVNFTLNRLDSNSSTVNLYQEHEASETILYPIRLTSLDVGVTTETAGQTLVVVFTRSDYTSGLSFTWDSVSSATSDILTAVNYVDSGEGRVLWNRFNRRERFTWALNLPTQNSLSLKAETQFGRCELANPCWCSYLGIYEVTGAGYLREVTRVCGRSSSFETDQLYPKLLAFVYINSTASVAGSDHVELTWAAKQPSVTTTTVDPWHPSQGPTEPPIDITTQDYSEIISLDCGGIIEVPVDVTSIQVGYKQNGYYSNNELCLWTVYSPLISYRSEGATFEISLVSDDLENYDEVHVMNVDVRSAGTSMTSAKLERNTSQRTSSEGVFLSFSSDSSKTRRGFVIKIEIVDTKFSINFRDVQSYSSSEGQVSFPNQGTYRNSERLSIVVNPPNPGDRINFSVDSVDIEDGGSSCTNDRLDIYTVGPYGSIERNSMWCGHQDSPVGNVLSTAYPVLAFFTTDGGSSNYTGFSISWNAPEQYSTMEWNTEPATRPWPKKIKM